MDYKFDGEYLLKKRIPVKYFLIPPTAVSKNKASFFVVLITLSHANIYNAKSCLYVRRKLSHTHL